MRELSLFSGIGCFSKGFEEVGCTPVGFVEIDPFCQAVLRKHWDDAPIHDDITTRDFHEGEADIITAGWPCQDISRAGQGAGLAGARSGLFWEVVRAIRLVGPTCTVLENVAEILHRGMGEVCGALAESGLRFEWDCVPAAAVGAPHIRDRFFAVAYPDDQGRLQPGWPFSDIGRRVDDRAPQAPWLHSWQEELSQIQGMDDGPATRLDSAAVDALGNALVSQIPQSIGTTIRRELFHADA